MAANQIQLTGTLTQLPSVVTGTVTSASPLGSIPAMTRQLSLVTTPSPKQSAKCASANKLVNSTGSFQTLSGIGSTDDVTTADFLYFKCDAGVGIQLTMQNLQTPQGANVVSIVEVLGMMVLEFPPGGYLLGMAVQGAANVEYIVSGPA